MKTPASLKALEAEYAHLLQQLACVGYLSKGSVVKRALGKPGSRYQWTTKVKAHTVSLTLSAEQYHWLKEAVTSQRKLERLLKKMHRLSRKIMRLKFPNQPRRNPLSKKSLASSLSAIPHSTLVHTVSLTLSAEQYHWLKEAVTSQRKLERLLKKMHRLSRKIMRLKFPNQPRRNPLSKRVLRLL